MSRKLTLTLIGALIAALVLLVGVYAVQRSGEADQVPDGVTAAGIDIGGLTRSEVEAEILSYEDSLAGTPASFLIDGTSVILDPASVGFDLQEGEVADAALDANEQRSFFSGLLAWLGISTSTIEIDVPATLDQVAIEKQLAAWEAELQADDSVLGGVAIRQGTPVALYATPVERIERQPALETITAVLADPNRPVVTLQTETAPSPVTDAMVDAAAELARSLLDGPITLTSDEPAVSVTLTASELLQAFRSETTLDPPAVTITLDHDVLDELFFSVREQFPGAFENAEFIVNADDTVSIKPGVTGPKVSAAEAVPEILAAAVTPERTGRLPLEDGARPDITTEDLEALGVRHLVSRFTTYHDCCASRVTNIHLIADAVDGVIVEPGETFGINDYVGERTTEKGYLPAGTIVNGEIVDTVGGGVSQFATTFYNAVFWGGYTDVTHKPHSYYFSRYPEGIEATINWPNVELAFRNDTDNAILIKATYTDTSITVSFYSDNAGTAVAGDQSGGITRTWIEMEGDGVVVTGSVSDRYSYTSPQTQYRTDSSMTPGSQSVIQSGREGWSVTVTRTKNFPDGSTEEETWVARYLAEPRIVRVHPCNVPGTSVSCPTTTTSPATTVPATSPPTTAPATTVPPPTAPATTAPAGTTPPTTAG